MRGTAARNQATQGARVPRLPPARQVLRCRPGSRTPLLRLGDPFYADLDGGDLAADLILDLGSQLRVRLQEVARVLTSLAQARLTVVEPGASLREDAGSDTDVKEAALATDSLVVHDVELGEPEWTGHLVLHDLDARPRSNRIRSGLQRLDATNVHAHARVELQGAATRGRLRVAKHDADLFAQLVGEDQCGVAPVDGTGQLAQCLAHQARLQPHEAVAHVSFDLRPG